MDKLQGMQLFTRVVEAGSFTAGAEQMGISRALASKLIQNLEDSLGVRLLNRTTRRISLTDPGKNYYQRVSELLAHYPNATEVVWLQEEPDNMGPRSFVSERLQPLVPDQMRFRQVSRAGSGSPATGSHGIHVQEQSQLMDEVFA